MREVDLVGFVLEEARPRFPDRIPRPQRRVGPQLLQIFEDLRRVEELELAVHKHGHLSFRIDPQHLGVLRIVAPVHVERDHDELDIEALFQRRDLRLRAEHAEPARVEPDRIRAHGPIP